MSAVSYQAVLGIALTVAIFWSLPARWRWFVLSAAGLGFLCFVAPTSAGLFIAVVASSYLAIRQRLTTLWAYVYAIVAFSLLLILRADAGGGWAWFGAAYYVLRALHAVIDSTRAPPTRITLRDYLAYMTFVPTLSVGPVERLPWFQREMERNRWNTQYFSAGLETLLYGYVQITFIGNYLINVSLASNVSLVENDVVRDWLECLRYGASLYFQFAGYSDIAIGFALLLGIRIRENFHRPYLAANIADFWRRWNISVTSWCRDYVNLPVLALTRNRSLAALASMLVLGLWHEASWRYLLWGAFHGAGIALWRGWRSLRDLLGTAPGRLESIMAWALTMLFVIASFAITKEDSMEASLSALARLAGWSIA
jgi:D-alanyl-lipoteichoic acid acyltransferase DltB (MBOAT superfamily)